MKPEPIQDYIITTHARFEMERRALSEALIDTVLKKPGQRREIRKGRHVLQSQIRMGNPKKTYLVRVFVDIDRTPCEVVTAYRTSRVARYWRGES